MAAHQAPVPGILLARILEWVVYVDWITWPKVHSSETVRPPPKLRWVCVLDHFICPSGHLSTLISAPILQTVPVLHPGGWPLWAASVGFPAFWVVVVLAHGAKTGGQGEDGGEGPAACSLGFLPVESPQAGAYFWSPIPRVSFPSQYCGMLWHVQWWSWGFLRPRSQFLTRHGSVQVLTFSETKRE